MIEAEAIVREVEGDRTLVEVQRSTACGGCESKGSCGTSVVAHWFPRRVSRIWVRSTTPVRVGETVSIAVGESVVLRASLLLYLLPVVALTSGGALASWVVGPGVGGDLPGIAGGVIGFAAGLAISRTLASMLLSRPDAAVVVLPHHSHDGGVSILMDPGLAGNTTRRSV